MKRIYPPFVAFALLFGFSGINLSCNTNVSVKTETQDSISIAKSDVINDEFLHQEAQAKLTPDLVLDILKKGNQDYVDDNLTIRNTSARIRIASLGQYPGAVILS